MKEKQSNNTNINIDTNNEYLINMLKKQYDENIIEKIIKGYECKRTVALRINTIKADIETIKQKIARKRCRVSNSAMV